MTASAAHTGAFGLHVVDNSTTLGSSVASQKFTAIPGTSYTVTGYGRANNSTGAGLYVQFYDVNGNGLSGSGQAVVTLANTSPNWQFYTVSCVAPANAATVAVWMHSFISTTVVADFDDLTISSP